MVSEVQAVMGQDSESKQELGTNTERQMEVTAKLTRVPSCMCIFSTHGECPRRMRCCILGSRVGKQMGRHSTAAWIAGVYMIL